MKAHHQLVPAANTDAVPEDYHNEAQRKERQTALNITRSGLHSGPLPCFTLLAVVASAVQIITNKVSSVSSETFETRQAAKEEKGEPRDFRAKVAATGDIARQSRQM